jgi:hypothetical protein
VPLVRPSSRIAFALSWLVFVVTAVLAWRQILSLPDGDPTMLFVATMAGALGLTCLGSWITDHESRPRG